MWDLRKALVEGVRGGSVRQRGGGLHCEQPTHAASRHYSECVRVSRRARYPMMRAAEAGTIPAPDEGGSMHQPIERQSQDRC
jgi:hypothetical protein